LKVCLTVVIQVYAKSCIFSCHPIIYRYIYIYTHMYTHTFIHIYTHPYTQIYTQWCFSVNTYKDTPSKYVNSLYSIEQMLELPEAKQYFQRSIFLTYHLPSLYFPLISSFFPQIIINHIICARKWLVWKVQW